MTPLNEADVDEASHHVGQMGTEAFCRPLRADVVVAGRACDTAIFAAVPALLGCAMEPTMHLAKIIECASLCRVPGGRDPGHPLRRSGTANEFDHGAVDWQLPA